MAEDVKNRPGLPPWGKGILAGRKVILTERTGDRVGVNSLPPEPIVSGGADGRGTLCR